LQVFYIYIYFFFQVNPTRFILLQFANTLHQSVQVSFSGQEEEMPEQ